MLRCIPHSHRRRAGRRGRRTHPRRAQRTGGSRRWRGPAGTPPEKRTAQKGKTERSTKPAAESCEGPACAHSGAPQARQSASRRCRRTGRSCAMGRSEDGVSAIPCTAELKHMLCRQTHSTSSASLKARAFSSAVEMLETWRPARRRHLVSNQTQCIMRTKSIAKFQSRTRDVRDEEPSEPRGSSHDARIGGRL